MTVIDTAAARTPDAVIGQLVTELGGALGVLLTALGLRCGLWTALADGAPATPAELAGRTGAMMDGGGGPRPGGGMVEACTDMFCSLGAEFADFTAAFRAGGGFGWHRHDDQFWRGSDGLTRVALPDELVAAILDELSPARGGSVLDVGGRGC
mgnify:CR=1 FL=1